MRPEVLVDLLEPLEGLWRVVAVADELAPRVLDAGAVVVLPGLDAVEELHAHLQVVWLRYWRGKVPSRTHIKTMNLSGLRYQRNTKSK